MPRNPRKRGYEEIDRLGDELGIDPDVVDVARAIFGQADDAGLLSGRPVEITAGAVIALSCRQNGLPYTTRDIIAVTAATDDPDSEMPPLMTRFERTRRKLESGLNIETGVVRPAAYIDRYVDGLGLSSRTESVAREVLSRAHHADSESLSGKSPSGVAGAAIYLATLLCDERRTQAEIGEIATSEIAIRSNYHTLLRLFAECGIRFEGDDLDTARFNREMEKVMPGNESPAEAQHSSQSHCEAHSRFGPTPT